MYNPRHESSAGIVGSEASHGQQRGTMTRTTRILMLSAVTVAAVVGIVFLPRIPQPLSYHNFADQRAFLGIPNFFDVASNLPFLLVGIFGLVFLLRHGKPKPLEWPDLLPYVVLFLGVALTCFGSAYYHLDPNNATLVWDRLPMTLGFMSILAAMIAERISVKAGVFLLAPLLIVGIASVLQWRASELRGSGDLRFYLAVQFLPMVLILMLMLLFPPRYTRSTDLLAVVGFYALAKILEAADRRVLNLGGHVFSGHTLKHLAAALAVYWILRMLKKRQPVAALISRAAAYGARGSV